MFLILLRSEEILESLFAIQMKITMVIMMKMMTKGEEKAIITITTIMYMEL